MTDPYEMIAQAAARQNLFPPSSRYHGLETAVFEQPDGTKAVWVRRRFVPPPEQFATLTEHTVVQGDRLDNLTARYLGDPEQFWRVCDGNGVMRPEELESIGRRVRITLPEGIPAPPNA
jgi:hypothetical protein